MSQRDRFVISIVVAIGAVAAAWVLVVSPKRDQAAKLATQVQAEQSQLQTAESQLRQAQSAQSGFSTAYEQLAKLGEAVPADDNVPSLIYQIQGAAKDSKVDFQALTVTPGGGSTTPAAAAGGPQTAPAQLPPGVTVGAAGFPAEQFSFTFKGSFFHLADFFNRLQRFVVASRNDVAISGRLMTLNSINLQPGANGFPQIDATVSATTYLEPPSQGLLGGASPAGPAASATQPVSGSPSSTSAPAAAITSPVK